MLPSASEVIDVTLKRSNHGDDVQVQLLWCAFVRLCACLMLCRSQGESKAPDVLLSEIALASSNHSGSDAGAHLASSANEASHTPLSSSAHFVYSPVVTSIDEAEEYSDTRRLRSLKERAKLTPRAHSEGAWDPFQ